MDEEIIEVGPRRRIGRWIAPGLIALLALVLLGVWLARKPIAADYIDRQLEKKGVNATYKVKRIGFRTERIEQVVIGDPAHPDATADWIEVELSLGFRAPEVTMIRARGVRLNGRWTGKRISLGIIDRLLPPPSNAPFSLPDQAVDLADTAIAIETPVGRVGVAIEGKGNLSNGFRGRLAGVAHRLRLAGCTLSEPTFFFNASVDRLRPTLDGPLRAAGATCGATEATAPQVALRTTLSPAADAWRGEAALRLASLRSGGKVASGLGGRVTFDGNAAETKGHANLGSGRVAGGGIQAAAASLAGDYSFSARSGRIGFNGDAAAHGLVPPQAAVRSAAEAMGSLGGTPFAPVADSLASAVRRAGRALDVSGRLIASNAPGGGRVLLSNLSAVSSSGARLAVKSGIGLSYAWPAGALRLDGDLALSGGGFPATGVSLSSADLRAPMSGIARIAPMRAGNASLALTPVRFSPGPRGTMQVSTVALASGPIPDGGIEGLVLPVEARIGPGSALALNGRCQTGRFTSLRTGSLTIGPTQLPLCPVGPAMLWKPSGGKLRGAIDIRAPRLNGRLGTAPIAIASDRIRVDFPGPTFGGSNWAIDIGRPGARTLLRFASLGGHFIRGGGGIAGTLSGGGAQIGKVPLIVSDANGPWTLRHGRLAVNGSLKVSDLMQPPRFYPLVSNDFHLTLFNNRIDAGGWLLHPGSGTRITRTTITHDLKGGVGHAALEVPGIQFGDRLQPEELTRLTNGVIALVNGVLRGRGDIGWGPGGATSTGAFSTAGMNLAAPFGPVEGLTTSIHFTDLLGLTSAPGQVADIDVIHAGIDVLDGVIRYQILPNNHVRVEGGTWPFAGGRLVLEETMLDFSQPSTKKLTFKVIGLDAQRFVEQMEFSNIRTTGIFDGTLPMEFDQRGGRIVGGHLVARAPGGTLSYLGELTDKDLGAYGKLAFDALKGLRFRSMTVDLNGSLEGEFLAGIKVDGVSRTTGQVGSGIAARILNKLADLPFRFNIQIRGPFRALIGTARSLEDPTNLIQPVLPDQLKDKPTTVTIQRDEKGTKK